MQTKTSYSKSDEFDALLALLRTVGDDVYSLACDIIALGELLSVDQGREPAADQIRHLQSFDAIGQRALAQARLVHGIERILTDCAVDWTARVDALIQTVPFHADRKRLFAVLQGRADAENDANANCGNNSELDLF